MGCIQTKSKRYQTNNDNIQEKQQQDIDVKNNTKNENISPSEVTRNTTSTAAKFHDRAIIPSLENKQVITLKDHFLKQNVQVPVLQPVEQSSLMAHRVSIQKQRTNSLSTYADIKKQSWQQS
ncbi:hypothetical protein TTHERM_00196090 (macronuclear) [Tetrahymena thermophila SB210]|uniref:Uncharacterized protein n=1 Tax=Tetrahymena thermophila (strain SB210) TaxID=312017 RepID=Q23K25_TETTS|nr:hypothetical protein TTHERM_00196090 [Tetrahymena thermophila SB210]EAR97018.1 hypothetical protein TTHERM_00196090 [Tetrahymena thermophila SB210]|eukprot:XP_001017263.1 hypothetical protein TTHERM_00196090 [Tetrahymena thermophila SB210]